ncbi:MAG: SDR family oxidoreductase [Candidatus Coprovivens sp.]
MKDYFNYNDKVCVVTGAASGIGLATARMLVECGAQVYAIDKNAILIPGVTKFIKADLSNKLSIDAAFTIIPEKIDCFFGVAGLSGAITNYFTTFTVNYIANVYITETYLQKRMDTGAAITYVTSTGGLNWEKYSKEYMKFIKAKTWEEMTNVLHNQAKFETLGVMAYPLSKRAMNYYTSIKSIELGARGIRVNAILPGSTNTGMKREFEAEAGGEKNLLEHTGVANRLATPEEIAEPLLFLNSRMARFISGELIIVDYADTTMIKLGLKKDKMNRKVGSKIFNSEMVQKKLKEQLISLEEERLSQPVTPVQPQPVQQTDQSKS